MAGAGYKLFATGDVLTAAQVNTYLMQQTVMVFASSAARTTALSGVVAEGMVSYLLDTNATEVYDGSAWVGIGNSGDITGVTAGTGLTGGGASGSVTLNLDTPVSATNGGTAQTTYTTGDLLYASASNTLSKRAIGSTGQVLTVSGGVPTWATPASGGGGKVLQVVQSLDTGYIAVTTTNTWSDSNLSATITPTSSTSKILVIISQQITFYNNNNTANGAFARLQRGSTTIWNTSATSEWVSQQDLAGGGPRNNVSIVYLDSPATTSATTYKPQYKQTTNANDKTLYFQNGNGGSSTITLMEIGA